MGLFDKIVKGIKEEIKSGIAELLDPDTGESTEAVSVSCGTPQTVYRETETYTQIYNTGDDHFAAIISDEKFPGYSIEHSIHASVFDASAHQKCYPITYLFRKNGTPVLAVLVMNRNQSRAMIAVGTYRVLDANGIPYIRFYKGMENREDYVINRIRENLS